MQLRINLFLLFIIIYLTLDLFLSKKNIFQYLEISKIIQTKQKELEDMKKKNEELEQNIALSNNNDKEFAEELLKHKFNLKLKNEYVIFFKKNQ